MSATNILTLLTIVTLVLYTFDVKGATRERRSPRSEPQGPRTAFIPFDPQIDGPRDASIDRQSNNGTRPQGQGPGNFDEIDLSGFPIGSRSDSGDRQANNRTRPQGQGPGNFDEIELSGFPIGSRSGSG